MTIGAAGTIPATKVIVMTDAMTVTEIDGHRLTVMAITQRPRRDVAKGDRRTPEVLADQDSPGGTKTEVTRSRDRHSRGRGGSRGRS